MLAALNVGYARGISLVAGRSQEPGHCSYKRGSLMADLEPQLAAVDHLKALLKLTARGRDHFSSRSGVWGGLAVILV